MKYIKNQSFGVSVFLFVMIVLGVISCGNNDTKKILQETVKEINKNCPVMVDEITRLDNCEVKDLNVFVYNYTILDETRFDVSVFQENGIPFVKQAIQLTPELEELRKREVVFRYVYRNLSGEELLAFDINPIDYK